jgi:anti-sigma28 factor (negative regulator of flagellin synthesis)
MSSVNNIGSTTPITPAVTQPVQKQVPSDAPKQVKASDRLELSGLSPFGAALKRNDIRADKVAEVKAQIANGTYGEDKKLDGALDGLLDDLAK